MRYEAFQGGPHWLRERVARSVARRRLGLVPLIVGKWFPVESITRVLPADKKIRLQPRNDQYSPTIVDGKRVDGIYRAVSRYEKL